MNNNEDTFLTQVERKQVQHNYVKILENMKQDDLIIKLLSAGHISLTEKENLQAKTNTDKRQYIIDEVLLKATYQQICSIREILVESGISGHILIAELLPYRNFRAATQLQQRRESYPVTPVTLRSSLPVQEESARHSYNYDDDSPTQPAIDSWDGSHKNSDPYLYAAGGNQSAPGGFLKKISRSIRGRKSSRSTPNISDKVPKLGCYGVKEGNHPIHGKALVVIIVNFTGDLEGYKNDVEALVRLHKDELHHELVFHGKIPDTNCSLENLTRDELINVLKVFQDYLKNPMSGNMIDRFFFYILSHGDKDGIMTCQKGSTKEVEGSGNSKTGQKEIKIRTQMQEIVDMFTHNEVDNLKGFPKVFINQSCRGGEILRAAGPGKDEVDLHKPPLWEPPSAKLAIGADVMVCEATSDTNLAWVSQHGSLYIQHLVQVISDYYLTEHFYDILVEVNNQLANKIKKGVDPEGGTIVQAAQMPCITSKLTKKLYLTGLDQSKAKFY